MSSAVLKQTNVGWLIDSEMFPHYREDLIAAIKQHGHTPKLIQAPSPPFRWDDVDCSYRETFPADQCVVSHGDIELVSRIHNDNRWTPGAFATIKNFHCSHYLNVLGEFWLNRDYVMLPFGDLLQQRDSLFDTFGIDGHVFVRPDSPLKLFTGQTASIESFEADVEYMGFYDFPEDSLVVVSSPKQIVREWRFVVADRSVVAGCLYSQQGEFTSKPEVDNDAKSLAEKIALTPSPPDPVWIIDICETSDGMYHMLEVGGFSFADLYACNKPDIVEAVSEVALAAWAN